MSALLNIGLSGLNAARINLNTTGHNIANENTAGYHRQQAIQVTNPAFFTGNGFIGQGTNVATVWRAYDSLLERQVQVADTRLSEYSTYYSWISQVNNMLADSTTGVSPAIAKFFSGVQEVAANPTSTAARQALISTGQSLVGSFKAMDSRLSEIRQSVESEIGETVAAINLYTRNIAELNKQITAVQLKGSALPANDLLDQRDQMITELNKLISVQTVQETDGSISVFIGSGQNLVAGGDITQLGAIPNPDEPSRLAIAIVPPRGAAQPLPENLISGGVLGGLLSFRQETLDKAQNQLGLLALGLATEFNNQHMLGQDLDGELGQAFFMLPSPAVIPSDAMTVGIDSANIGQLSGSDYELSFDGVNYTLTRLSDGVRVINGGPLPTPPNSIDGLTFSGAGMAAGDTALIQPTRYAARDIAVAINDPRKIAAGNPVSVSAPLGNQGNGKVDGIVVKDTSGMVVTPPEVSFAGFSMTYNGAPGVPGTFTLPPGYTLTSGNPPVADNTFDPATDTVGKTFTLTGPGGLSFEFTISGTPSDQDEFAFAPTEKGVADNRNANLLGALQTKNIFFDSVNGATASGNGLYAQLVTDVGNKTRELNISKQSQQALLTQATTARDSVSGVNVDEELANLLRFQYAFQASAKVMSTAQVLFDAVLSISR